jgi:hypothetical protein
MAALGVLVVSVACGDGPTTSDAALTPVPGSGGLVQFSGDVEAVAQDSLTVADRTFVVDEQTVTLRDGREVSFLVVDIDDFVLLKAFQNRHGEWVAREIKLR